VSNIQAHGIRNTCVTSGQRQHVALTMGFAYFRGLIML